MANHRRSLNFPAPLQLPRLLAACLGLALLPHLPGSATPVLSEFMASNATGLLDEDREPSDWIEIHNPAPTPVNHARWSLTDDPSQPTLWQFPNRTLPPGGYLVVFASGKNRAAASPAPLHTNFRLNAAGDYLALIQPDGRTVASAFTPSFPPQEPDVSYGTPQSAGPRDLLGAARVSVLIPTNAAMLESSWTQPGFTPSAAWKPVTSLPLGFDATPASPAANTNLARAGKASQSTDGFGFPADLALDGDPASFTHTAGDDNNSTWSVDLGKVYELSRIVLRNRTSCCQTRLRDLTVSLIGADGTTEVWRSELLNPENELGSPASLVLDFAELNIDAPVARIVRIQRTPDPDLSGSSGQGNADEDSVLSLGEVEVYGVSNLSFAALLRADLTDAMRGRNPSAFVRIPFVLEDPAAVRSLTLRMRYNDGLVAHLNGSQVALRNAPENALWNSAALSARNKTNSLEFESLDLTPFRQLWQAGTNWLAFQILNVNAFDPDLFLDASLVPDFGPGSASFTAYLDKPTPGAANDTGWNLGRVADTRFSVDRGLFNQPFSLAITSETPDAEIRYTLDGSLPTAANGTLYTTPLRIDRTTVLRAVALKNGYRPSDVDTQTYLFLQDIVNQPARPPGFPTSWAGIGADYAMDPRITQAAAWTNRMAESLKSVPSLSIVTANDNLFGASQGIYANPERSGIAWERPISMEWIEPDGREAFQVDCGLRIQGGYFRQRSVTHKHSLRLLFKNEYGPGRLNQDLFHVFGAAREFDTLVLRAGANDGYAWDAARDTEQFLRDQFGRDLLRALGQVSGHGRFVHVYLNGLYWGVFNLTERPAEDFSATYFGGLPEDWDAINAGDVKNGSLQAWNNFLTGVRTTASLADYQKLKGLNPDGSRNTSFPGYLDAPNYMDYMLVNIWGGNWDWPNKNFWFGFDRTLRERGFKFYLWDFENTMGNNRDRSPLNMVSPRAGTTTSWVGEPHDRLKRASAEYRLEFADRVQRAFFNGGPLSPQALVARYRELAKEVEPAILAETARWGDDHWNPPQDLTDWQRERDWLLNNYLPQRTAVVLGQFRTDGLYPQTAAPTFTPAGGAASPGTPIRITVAASELYYTTNGLDPRLPGGAIRPDALKATFATSPNPTANPNLIRSGHSWRYLDNGSDPGTNWREGSFNDGAWKTGPSPLGYGDNDEATVVGFVDANPAQAGVQKNATTFFRTTFDLATPAAFERLRVVGTYDDALAVYLNGREILRSDNLPADARFNSYASSASADNATASREDIPASHLVAGRNVVAVEVHQSDGGSSDISFDLELTGLTSSTGQSHTLEVLLPNATTRFAARAREGTDWSALSEVFFTPDTLPASSNTLVVSEFCYRPANPTNTVETAISRDRDDFEFLELLNVSPTTLDLGGCRFSQGILFNFPAGTLLPAGRRLLLVRHAPAFAARYGNPATVAGEYEGSLDNNGEAIELLDRSGQPIARFRYDNNAPWPTSPGEAGYSLVLIRPESRPNPAQPQSWRASAARQGSPGTSDSQRFTGNPTADANNNGQADLLDHAFGTLLGSPDSGFQAGLLVPTAGTPGETWFTVTLPRNPTADDVAVLLEFATSLDGPWRSDPGLLELAAETRTPQGPVLQTYRLTRSLAAETAAFVRISVALQP